jgi:hypothetical protein
MFNIIIVSLGENIKDIASQCEGELRALTTKLADS